MPTRGNKHIRKFNQLVDVYDPDPIDQIDPISTRDEEQLQQLRTDVQHLQTQVAQLTAEDFFSPREHAEIATNDSLPDPNEVVRSHRADLLARLDDIETALAAATETTGSSDDLTL